MISNTIVYSIIYMCVYASSPYISFMLIAGTIFGVLGYPIRLLPVVLVSREYGIRVLVYALTSGIVTLLMGILLLNVLPI
jgi:hypothetical protein